MAPAAVTNRLEGARPIGSYYGQYTSSVKPSRR